MPPMGNPESATEDGYDSMDLAHAPKGLNSFILTHKFYEM